MKKALTALLVVLMIFSAACGKDAKPLAESTQQAAESARSAQRAEDASLFESGRSAREIPLAESPFKTLGDALSVETETYQSSVNEERDTYIYVFPAENKYYRVEAELTPELANQVDAIDFFDEERDAKILALLQDQPIVRVYDLSAAMYTQAELDTLIGRTGQELLDMGFTHGSGYSFWEKAELYLVKGLFEYHFFFKETVPERDDYDEALDEILKSLTVEKVEFFGLADACSDPDVEW